MNALEKTRVFSMNPVGLVALGLIISGCATPKTEPVPPPSQAAFPFSTNCTGLVISVDPYFQPERVKRHFGWNSLSKGILPVCVAFKNLRSEGAYLLQPESVGLLGVDQAGARMAASGSDLVASRGGALSAAGSSLVVAGMFFPLTLAAGAPIALVSEERQADRVDIAKHMETLRFQDRPLYPSDSNSGFLYFQLAKAADLQRVSAFQFQLRNLRTQEPTTVIIPVRSP